MGEVSLTGWLDPVLKYFSEQSGIPLSDYSAQVGGEGVATALEIVADLFTKGWLNKGVQFIAGLIASSYAVWGKEVPTRLRKELLALGTHELLRIATIKPQEITEIQSSLLEFLRLVQSGRFEEAAMTVLTTPQEIQSAFRMLKAPAAPAPAVKPQVPVPAPTRKEVPTF